MIGIFLGISTHKAVVWGLASLTFLTGLIAAITADSVLGVIAMMGGVALGMLLLREKVRDYRTENWKKQAENLNEILNTERQDHERTRERLRAILAQEIDRAAPR